MTNQTAVPPLTPADADGAALIAAERARQVASEGWTPERDDRCNIYGELVWAAKWRRPECDHVTELVKAGALIAAEIDRLQRIRSVDGGDP